MNSKILFIVLLGCIGFNLQAQDCLDTEALVEIEILTDEYPQETSWSVSLQDGTMLGGESLNGTGQFTFYTAEVCVPLDECIIFTIYDQAGDGICCGYGEGNYTLSYDGDVIGEGGDFGAQQETAVGCPEGSICSSGIEIETETDNAFTAPSSDTWYVLVPEESGQFTISTCDLGNTCNTSIFVYDYCVGLDWDDTAEGSIYYSNGGCEIDKDIAVLNANLVGGTTYYIRIGDEGSACADNAIEWTINYNGPIQGCTDEEACNFNPLAGADDGSCIFPGDPECPDGPDLIVLDYVIANSLAIEQKQNDDACYTEEKCMTGYGMRQIMRFTTHIENIGESDYYIGVPPADETQADEQWEWDPCHGHWHYEGYGEYVLYDENNNEIPIGFKNGFCVMDLDCSYGGGIAKYGCGNQGISAHCGDIYDSYLECQWIDVTDVPDGNYTLVVRVNWDKSPDNNGNYEVNFSNNWGQVCINLSTNSSGTKSVQVVDACNPIVDCLGEIYGDAALDCEGNCNGGALQGDYNADANRDNGDVTAYVNAILSDNANVTTCNDLNGDGTITATDAILVATCMTQEVEPNGEDGVCEFPYGITNIMDSVGLSIGTVNTMEQYIEINITNPTSKIFGGQFEMEGIEIESLEFVNADHTDIFYAQHSDNEVVLVNSGLDFLTKNADPLPLLRVYYGTTTQDLVCISEIITIVNEAREEVITSIDGTCESLLGGNTSTEVVEVFAVKVGPNPFEEYTIFTFDNTQNETLQLEIINIDGKVVAAIENITGNQYKLERGKLSTGMYTYKITGKTNVQKGKVIVY